MSIDGISHITFLATDLGRTARLLCEGLGAKEVYDSVERNFSISREKFFTLGGAWIAVMEGKPVDRSYRHVAFKVNAADLPGLEARLRLLGAEIKPSRPRIEGEGQSLYFYDFDNNLFELHTGTLEQRLQEYTGRQPIPSDMTGRSPAVSTHIGEAIDRLSAAISADPAKARGKNLPATARLVDGLRCELTGPYNERLVTDMAPAVGGTASGPNPGWLLRGALASCTATVIAMRAAKLGVALSSLEVTVETDSDLRGILGLDENISAGHGPVRIQVRIGAADTPPDVLREIVAWADRHSPVNCTVRDAPECSLAIEVVP